MKPEIESFQQSDISIGDVSMEINRGVIESNRIEPKQTLEMEEIGNTYEPLVRLVLPVANAPLPENPSKMERREEIPRNLKSYLKRKRRGGFRDYLFFLELGIWDWEEAATPIIWCLFSVLADYITRESFGSQ